MQFRVHYRLTKGKTARTKAIINADWIAGLGKMVGVKEINFEAPSVAAGRRKLLELILPLDSRPIYGLSTLADFRTDQGAVS